MSFYDSCSDSDDNWLDSPLFAKSKAKTTVKVTAKVIPKVSSAKDTAVPSPTSSGSVTPRGKKTTITKRSPNSNDTENAIWFPYQLKDHEFIPTEEIIRSSDLQSVIDLIFASQVSNRVPPSGDGLLGESRDMTIVDISNDSLSTLSLFREFKTKVKESFDGKDEIPVSEDNKQDEVYILIDIFKELMKQHIICKSNPTTADKNVFKMHILRKISTPPSLIDQTESSLSTSRETMPMSVDLDIRPASADQHTRPTLVDQETRPILVDHETRPIQENQDTRSVLIDPEMKPARISTAKRPATFEPDTTEAPPQKKVTTEENRPQRVTAISQVPRVLPSDKKLPEAIPNFVESRSSQRNTQFLESVPSGLEIPNFHEKNSDSSSLQNLVATALADRAETRSVTATVAKISAPVKIAASIPTPVTPKTIVFPPPRTNGSSLRGSLGIPLPTGLRGSLGIPGQKTPMDDRVVSFRSADDKCKQTLVRKLEEIRTSGKTVQEMELLALEECRIYFKSQDEEDRKFLTEVHTQRWNGLNPQS
jgi:hypothetical protein